MNISYIVSLNAISGRLTREVLFYYGDINKE